MSSDRPSSSTLRVRCVASTVRARPAALDRGLVLAAVLLASGCTFSRFNDFEKNAPAAKIEQEGSRSSAAFGVDIAALPRRQGGASEPLAGAALVVSGNGPVALNTVTFSVDGSFSNSEADNDDFREDLGEPDQITALTPAPWDITVTGYTGPFVYVGLSRQKFGAVRLVDITSYAGPGELTSPDDAIENFGLAVRAANLGGADQPDDLAVGAKGAVVLWRSANWPSFSRPGDAMIVDESPRWPASGSFEAIAAGDLATSGRDEVAVAARDKNFVAVIHHIAGYGNDACDGVCVDTTADVNHCGSCGNLCGEGESCIAGDCRLPDACDAPLKTCEGRCVAVLDDNSHCGSCGNGCDVTSGFYCRAGACVCGAKRSDCGGACVDTSSNPAHCGGCGKACKTGEVCEDGACKTGGCRDGLTECDGACVDTTGAAEHCGACGDACTGNLTCQGSQCSCVPFQVLEIPLPENANGFGASLLIANVDKDEPSELIVGAPDTSGGGAAYVYELRDAHFDGSEPVPDPTVVTPEQGALSFGAALAVGEFNGQDRLLAIGAPSSDVGNTTKAGKIYLYDNQLKNPVGTIELVRPVEKGQLGGTLSTMPFKGSDRLYDVLTASSDTAVYVFFANTTPDHEDIRSQ